MPALPEETPNTATMRKVAVWDAPVRVFHWTLVVLIAFSWWSGEQGGNWMTYHMWSGYTILTLIAFRIIWGFIGSTHARFGDFLYGPGAVMAYLKTLPSRTAAKFAGHNPLGGLSVVLMILCVALQAVTGLFANDDISTEGPLYNWVSKGTSDTLTTIHKYNFNVLLALVVVHIGAVLYYLIYKRENLIGAMFTGRKHLPDTLASADRRMAGTGLAVVVVVILGAAVWLLVRQR